jgi:hypothetical protein
MIAYWYKTYIQHFGKGVEKKEKKGKVVTTGISDVNKSYCNLLVMLMKRSILVMLTN